MSTTLQSRYEAEFVESRRLFERARAVFPDGVTHDSRRLEPFPPAFCGVDRAEVAAAARRDRERVESVVEFPKLIELEIAPPSDDW